MKKNLVFKFISIMLVTSFLFQIFSPSIVVAQELIGDQNTDKEVVENTEQIMPTGKIIDELEEKRQSNVKYFLRDDNTFEAAYYVYDVHYLKDGVYKDINNKLVLKYDYSNFSLLPETYENTDNKFDIKFKKNFDNTMPSIPIIMFRNITLVLWPLEGIILLITNKRIIDMILNTKVVEM